MRNRGCWTASVATGLLLVAGCKGEPEPAATQSAALGEAPAATEEANRPVEDATTTATTIADAGTGGGRSEKVENDLYQFSYVYPDAAGAIPGLKAELDRQLDQQRGELAASARDDRAEAKKNDYPYRPHSYEETWKVVASLPGWLSVSSDFYTYAGGAHGMSGADTLLWDRHAQAVRKPVDLFVSKAALSKALRAPFCAALNKERGKKRGAPVVPGNEEMFNDCIDPLEQVVILGSSNGQTFDRIGVLVPPYNAGPYAEGSHEVTLPVTGAVMAALKPQYRASFSPGR